MSLLAAFEIRCGSLPLSPSMLKALPSLYSIVAASSADTVADISIQIRDSARFGCLTLATPSVRAAAKKRKQYVTSCSCYLNFMQ